MKNLYLLSQLLLILTFLQCAKKGRPNGGPKDEDPPLFVMADPPYETIHFDKNEITLYFNEYIRLKDVNKQLVISPPLNPLNPAIISPQGTPSKRITIKILDTLLENATYIFDFGNSVQDNNESNVLERFKYVVSTGEYIDSLTLEGNVESAFTSKNIKDVKLLLYRLDSSFTDSAVYKRKPDYVTSTLDSSNYKFSNLRKGRYFLVALNDFRSDYIFNPKTDEIGFLKDPVVLPRDRIITRDISIFKEELPYLFSRAKEVRKGQLIFGYQGTSSGLKVETLSEVADDFRIISFPEKGKDTLNVWHTPIENDSLIFKLTHDQVVDTVIVRLRKKKIDSLVVSQTNSGVLNHKDTLFFTTNNPIIKLDASKMSLVDADTTNIVFKSFISKKAPKIGFIFEKKFKTTYTLSLYPGALLDIFKTRNDTIKSQFRTRGTEDYGEILVAIKNPNKTPVVIQLTDLNDKTIAQQTATKNETIAFNYLNPKEYKIRIVYDLNSNGKWDTGNYLQKRLPEQVAYFPEILEVRPNWILNETIEISELN